MNKKRIAVLTPVLPPYHGGIGKAAFSEAECLVKEHEVVIFTPKYAYINKDEENRNGVAINYIKPLFSFGNAAILPNLRNELKDFDIVYLHYPFFGTAELLTYNLQPTTYNLVVRYHMDVVGRGWLKPLFWFHTKFIMSKILASADKIIVSTLDYARNSNIKTLIKKYSDKFIEIPFGVDTEKFKPEPKDLMLLQKYKLSPEDKILLSVGGLDRAHYFKGLDLLLSAIYKLKAKSPAYGIPHGGDYKLVIVGDGNLRSHYEILARKLGITNIVKFVGSISSKDLPNHYNLADLFVFPSVDRSEAFGLALLEAAACGKPVVASNLAGVRTLIKEGKNGFLVQPGDARELSEKITQAFKNSESFGSESRRLVETNYAQEKIASQLLDFFDRLC